MTHSGHSPALLILATAGILGMPAALAQLPVPPLLPPPVTAAPPVSPLPAIAPRPASHLLDESGMFSEADAKVLSSRLLSCQTRTGLALYLTIHTYLTDETADSRARRTHAAWLEGQGAGIIVVHDRSTGRLSFAGSDDKRLPAADGLIALYRLADSAAKSLPPEASASTRLAATLSTLADGLEAWQKNGRLPAPPPMAAVVKSAPADPATPAIKPPWTLPGTFLVDEAGVFTGAAEATALRQRLEAWHRETGLSLYVVTVTYPPENSTLPLSEKLALEWLPEKLGAVIVYDRSQPNLLSIGGTPQVERWFSSVQLQSVHAGALAAASRTGEQPSARIAAAVSFLTDAYARDGLPILQESQRLLSQNQRRVIPWVIAAFSVCAGALYLFKRGQERADRRRRTVFLFPEVYVPQRLGAPHGGGITAELLAGAPIAPAVVARLETAGPASKQTAPDC